MRMIGMGSLRRNMIVMVRIQERLPLLMCLLFFLNCSDHINELILRFYKSREDFGQFSRIDIILQVYMWSKNYRDYKLDQPLIKNKVDSGRGIIGCEMHDLNGWGEHHHKPAKKVKRGIVATLVISFFSLWNKSKD